MLRLSPKLQSCFCGLKIDKELNPNLPFCSNPEMSVLIFFQLTMLSFLYLLLVIFMYMHVCALGLKFISLGFGGDKLVMC